MDRRGRRRGYPLSVRTFREDVLACPRYKERLKLIALIKDPKAMQKICAHLGLLCSTYAFIVPLTTTPSAICRIARDPRARAKLTPDSA